MSAAAIASPDVAQLTWRAGQQPPAWSAADIVAASRRIREPIHVIADSRHARIGVGLAGEIVPAGPRAGGEQHALVARLGPLYPEWLGDRSFGETHGVQFPYVVGEMARGIASVALVVAAARAGLLAFFGAAGLPASTVAAAIDQIESALAGSRPAWGVNVIHQPMSPGSEQEIVDLLLAKKVVRASASAFMQLTDPIVQYASTGLMRDRQGAVCRTNHLFAKVSRAEVAKLFMEPAPEAMLTRLVRSGRITAEEALLASRVPLCEDITVEADSGGHTDNRPLAVALPGVRLLADQLARSRGYDRTIRVGAAGGIGTAAAAASAFAMGASYVLTGSVNQATRQAAVADDARDMLAAAGPTDFAMAPSADMFEIGARVQVLRRGTLFAPRACRLYALYQRHSSLDDLPADARVELETEVFRMPLEAVWDRTSRFLQERDPVALARAEANPRVRMAMVLRWYLGLTSRWPIESVKDRRVDYQLWAGPALGAFNDWVRGTFLEPAQHRDVAEIAYNILEGAATLARAQQLRSHGVPVPPEAFRFVPRPLTS